jgi:hypothetical protein
VDPRCVDFSVDPLQLFDGTTASVRYLNLTATGI